MSNSVSAGSRSRNGLVGTVAVKASEVSFRAVIGDAPILVGPTVGRDGTFLTVEKPGSFILEYDLSDKHVCFQFMSTVKLFKKPFNWTYSHTWRKKTVVDGSFVFSPANKLAASYGFASTIGHDKIYKLKYSYNHRQGTSIEPSYDISNKSWEWSVSQRIGDRNAIAAVYNSSTKKLGLEYLYRSLWNKSGSFKISTTLCFSEGFRSGLVDGVSKPKVWAENTWDFEL